MHLRQGTSAKLARFGRQIGRARLAGRVLELVAEFNRSEQTYSDAIALAGRMRAIAMACQYDDYWDEKAAGGFHNELNALEASASHPKL